jgi:hypothetical protein
MPKVSVSIPRRGMEPITVDAAIPFIGCPLGATPVIHSNGNPDKTLGWYVTHLPTGFKFGPIHKTRGAALALINKCDPWNPDWANALGTKDDDATQRCYELAQKALYGDA